MIRVSVIVPVYNAERFLQKTLESVLAQTGVDFEVIAVDDGSTDGSPAILAQYAGRIVQRRQPNAGQATAMNTALEIATGDYIAYLDADDLCLPGRLAEQARYLDEHPEVDLVYTPSEYIDEDDRSLASKRPTPPDPLTLLYANYVPHSSVMHRRSCLDRAGRFDASYVNQDWDMWVRLSEHGRFALIEQPLIRYRVHTSNISRTRSRPLNHYRHSRMVMLEKTSLRRGQPWWLRAMALRARVEWWLLSHPRCSERRGWWWWGAHSVWNAIEMRVVRMLAGDRVTPASWRD